MDPETSPLIPDRSTLLNADRVAEWFDEVLSLEPGEALSVALYSAREEIRGLSDLDAHNLLMHGLRGLEDSAVAMLPDPPDRTGHPNQKTSLEVFRVLAEVFHRLSENGLEDIGHENVAYARMTAFDSAACTILRTCGLRRSTEEPYEIARILAAVEVGVEDQAREIILGQYGGGRVDLDQL